MKRLLIIGAGRSSSALINHFRSKREHVEVVIGDLDHQSTQTRYPDLQVIPFNITNHEAATEEIRKADLVISMLPASFHIHVAKICAAFGIHLITASYLSKEIAELADLFKAKNVMCIMEAGLDPGIDHMSGMKVLDRIKAQGFELLSFETFTGGLLAENNQQENPWKYKFTWNPRNVVLAGTGVVKFIQEGRFKYIPYHRLFNRTEVIHIPGYGYFEGYANRDSLKYQQLYGLEGIQTLFRGTLRRPGFCKAWNIFVQLGATDDSYEMDKVSEMTHRQFINSFLQFNPHDSVELKLAHYLKLELESEEMYKLQWLGMFDHEPVGLTNGTPAQILEHILKKKWSLNEFDRDMIVMWHKFVFNDEKGIRKEIQSHMVTIGDNQVDTAMAKTVGLPLAILAELILDGRLTITGIHIPTIPEIYNPVLDRLDQLGFEFAEREIQVS